MRLGRLLELERLSAHLGGLDLGMSTIEFLDHLTTIFFDLVMPALSVWIITLLREILDHQK